jgi:PIN domain nuclease of toxin-antitoxin system
VIYLDTHVAEPLTRGKFGLLSKDASRLLNRDRDIRISPMVVVELQYLFEIGRLSGRASEIVLHLRSSLGVTVCDRPFAEVALQASAESWTRDVFDRIIVAQARLAKAPLITRDGEMLAHYNKALT